MPAMKGKGRGCATVTAFVNYKNKKNSAIPPLPLFIFLVSHCHMPLHRLMQKIIFGLRLTG